MAKLPSLAQVTPLVPRRHSPSFILDFFRGREHQLWGAVMWGPSGCSFGDTGASSPWTPLEKEARGVQSQGRSLGGGQVAASGSRVAPSGAVLCRQAWVWRDSSWEEGPGKAGTRPGVHSSAGNTPLPRCSLGKCSFRWGRRPGGVPSCLLYFLVHFYLRN